MFTSVTNDVLSAITGKRSSGSIFDANIAAGYTLDNLGTLTGNIMLTILITSVIIGMLLIITGMSRSRQMIKGDAKNVKK